MLDKETGSVTLINRLSRPAFPPFTGWWAPRPPGPGLFYLLIIMRPKPRNHKSGKTVLFVVIIAALFAVVRFYRAIPRVKPAPSPVEFAEGTRPCELIRVVDGDTAKVRWNGRGDTVRLLRINTPERGRRGYKEATRALRSILRGGDIALDFETHEAARDRYGRLLAYLIAGGQNASVEMVRRGWSRYWTKYGRGKHEAELRAAEQEARRHLAGLWTARGWGVEGADRI